MFVQHLQVHCCYVYTVYIDGDICICTPALAGIPFGDLLCFRRAAGRQSGPPPVVTSHFYAKAGLFRLVTRQQSGPDRAQLDPPRKVKNNHCASWSDDPAHQIDMPWTAGNRPKQQFRRLTKGKRLFHNPHL
jgi:hypothetical protein